MEQYESSTVHGHDYIPDLMSGDRQALHRSKVYTSLVNTPHRVPQTSFPSFVFYLASTYRICTDVIGRVHLCDPPYLTRPWFACDRHVCLRTEAFRLGMGYALFLQRS
jgi:hypothetical protein